MADAIPYPAGFPLRAPTPFVPANPGTIEPEEEPIEREHKMGDVSTTIPGAAMAHTIHSGAGSAAAGMGAGLGVGGLALGGLGGLIIGSMLGNNGNGLFGNNRNDAAGPAVALGYGNVIEAVADSTLATVQSSAATQAAVLSAAGTVNTAIAQGNLNTLQSVNGLGATLQAASTQNLIQSLQSFNSLQSATQAGFNTSNIIAQNGFNALQTQTMESAADIKAGQAAIVARAEAIAASQALALQECCCKMQTQALENTQKILDQAASFRMQDLQIDNSNLRQTLALRDNNDAQTRIILSHLAPCNERVVRTA